MKLPGNIRKIPRVNGQPMYTQLRTSLTHFAGSNVGTTPDQNSSQI